MNIKGIILAAAVVLGGLFSARAEAFILIELGCKLCDPTVIASVSDPALKASLQECCKCHAPCMPTSGGGAVIDPVFESCLKNKEICPNGCKTDAECPDAVANDCKGRKCNVATGLCEDTVIPNCPPPPCDKTPMPSECDKDADCEKDGDMCTAPHCNKAIVDAVCPDGTKWGYTLGMCGPSETPIAGCTPKTCADKYPGDTGAIRCCEKGFDADPVTFKCCRKHVALGEPYADKITGKPIPCNGDETCPKCPDCRPPVVDCNVIADPAMKACCVAKGGFLWFMMNSCVHNSGDCNIIANIGGDVNGQLNICCNVLNNTGTISGSTIEQSCNNVTGGTTGGGTTGSGTGTPTTPASLGICEVKCKEVDCSIAVNTGGEGVAWTVTYSPPPGVGPVASVVLKQTSGDVPLMPEEPAPSGSGALSIKSIADPSSLPPFTVFTKKPESLVGAYLPEFTVAVQLNDLSDHELATLTCGNETALEAKGGGSGCGCFLGASPVEFGVNAIFLLSLFGGLPVLIRRLRRKP
ncbi:MAG TPA: hypothetical protein VFX30_01705 [bacterium]|nr:hypothetical protein [bacterium]